MTSSVASESTPMSRPLGSTRAKSITPHKTACLPTDECRSGVRPAIRGRGGAR
jgi:hypothetical protein